MVPILAFVFIVGLGGLAWIILRESEKARRPGSALEFDAEFSEAGGDGVASPAGTPRPAKAFGHREALDTYAPPEATERVAVPGFDTPLDESLAQYRAGRKGETPADEPVRLEPILPSLTTTISPATELSEPAPPDAPVPDPVVEAALTAIVPKPVRKRAPPKPAVEIGEGAAPPKPARRPRVKKEV